MTTTVKGWPKRRLVLFGFVLLFFVAGLTAIYLVVQSKNKKSAPNVKTVTIDGKVYTADYLTIQKNGPNISKPVSPEQQITKLENDISQGKKDYATYIELAQTYVDINNIPKAIENYEKAKTVLDPKDPNYKSTVAFVDRIINELKKSDK